jgi:hypothetical protein
MTKKERTIKLRFVQADLEELVETKYKHLVKGRISEWKVNDNLDTPCMFFQRELDKASDFVQQGVENYFTELDGDWPDQLWSDIEEVLQEIEGEDYVGEEGGIIDLIYYAVMDAYETVEVLCNGKQN